MKPKNYRRGTECWFSNLPVDWSSVRIYPTLQCVNFSSQTIESVSFYILGCSSMPRVPFNMQFLSENVLRWICAVAYQNIEGEDLKHTCTELLDGI